MKVKRGANKAENTINTTSYPRSCSIASKSFEFIRTEEKHLVGKCGIDAHIHVDIQYMYYKNVEKLVKKRMCLRRGVSSYDQRGSSFFKLDRFLPNLVQLSLRNPSRVFSKICRHSQILEPILPLKLGSFFQRDKSHCGFLASVATRSRGNFPVLIVHFFDLLSNVCADIFNLEKYIYIFPQAFHE